MSSWLQIQPENNLQLNTNQREIQIPLNANGSKMQPGRISDEDGWNPGRPPWNHSNPWWHNNLWQNWRGAWPKPDCIYGQSSWERTNPQLQEMSHQTEVCILLRIHVQWRWNKPRPQENSRNHRHAITSRYNTAAIIPRNGELHDIHSYPIFLQTQHHSDNFSPRMQCFNGHLLQN